MNSIRKPIIHVGVTGQLIDPLELGVGQDAVGTIPLEIDFDKTMLRQELEEWYGELTMRLDQAIKLALIAERTPTMIRDTSNNGGRLPTWFEYRNSFLRLVHIERRQEAIKIKAFLPWSRKPLMPGTTWNWTATCDVVEGPELITIKGQCLPLK